MRGTVSLMLLLFGVLAGPMADAAPDLKRIPLPRHDRFNPNPYPGGSPFPPGGEPSLPHVVQAYWTTAHGQVTPHDGTVNGRRHPPPHPPAAPAPTAP